VRTILRDRLLDAAAAAFAEQGWRRLTMAKVADRAGVSRQTVYNEFGTKQALAEQLVMRELDVFLDVVREGFESQTEFEPAVRAAVLNALTVAEENALLKAVLEAGHTGDTELLPYIFQSQDVIDTAVGFLHDLVVQHFPDLPLQGEPLAVALESVVRLALSHLTVPTRSKSRTAEDLAWIAGAVLAGVSERPTVG
jgi:AcrR family transcriptional regulator